MLPAHHKAIVFAAGPLVHVVTGPLVQVVAGPLVHNVAVPLVHVISGPLDHETLVFAASLLVHFVL